MLGSYNIIQCHIIAIALGMFYGAKYTHHPFTKIIKQQIKLQQQQQTLELKVIGQ